METNISESLEKIGNSATGSTFDVIGKTEDMVIAIRFWAEQHPKIKHNTVVSFRIRIAEAEGVAQQLNFVAHATATFPKVKQWSGQSSKHVSMMGYIGSKYPIWKATEILDGIVKDDLNGQIHKFIVEHLEGVSWVLDDDKFKAYVLQQVTLALSSATHIPDEDPKAPGAVLAFDKGSSGGTSHPSFQGEYGHDAGEACGLNDGNGDSAVGTPALGEDGQAL